MTTDTTQTLDGSSGTFSPNFLYADRITDFGIGPGVTKLTLGMEATPGNFKTVNTLVLPTHAFLEALEYILTSVKENEQLREPLLKQIQAFHDNVKSGL